MPNLVRRRQTVAPQRLACLKPATVVFSTVSSLVSPSIEAAVISTGQTKAAFIHRKGLAKRIQLIVSVAAPSANGLGDALSAGKPFLEQFP
jgi:hypothetical protein